jgi:hypothetical protein
MHLFSLRLDTQGFLICIGRARHELRFSWKPKVRFKYQKIT